MATVLDAFMLLAALSIATVLGTAICVLIDSFFSSEDR